MTHFISHSGSTFYIKSHLSILIYSKRLRNDAQDLADEVILLPLPFEG